MARIKAEQEAVGVMPAPVAPQFDRSKPYSDAIEGQVKMWVQNGWLYRRGTCEPVREVK